MEFDIEKSIEQYFRHQFADEIDENLYQTPSEDPKEQQQTYWFNQGMMLASMIVRWGMTGANGEDYR
jgi:hypothetical protein